MSRSRPTRRERFIWWTNGGLVLMLMLVMALSGLGSLDMQHLP